MHCFTDGRDTGPHAGARGDARARGAAGARIGSVIGRYWAMDRDRRWDRTQRAYDLLVGGRAPHHAPTALDAVTAAYERGETDEFIEPTLVGRPAPIAPGDRVLCFNFRPDRMRQLVRALADPEFAEIDRGGAAPVARSATLTEYEEGWPYPVAFAPEHPATTLAAVIAASGARQLHVAETEKYPHVTYFFNGGEEQPLPGERRELVPSPARRADLRPQARDERAGRRRRLHRRLARGSAPLRGDQLRQPRHGRAHGGDRRGGARRRGGRWMPGRGRARRCTGAAARASSPPITATARRCSKRDGSPQTAHSLSPVPLIATDRRRARCARGSSPTWRPPCSSCSASPNRRR